MRLEEVLRRDVDVNVLALGPGAVEPLPLDFQGDP